MISKIEFMHGEKTCAIEAKPCVWQGMSGFGTRPVCVLFGRSLYGSEHGMARCPQCIERFGGGQ